MKFEEDDPRAWAAKAERDWLVAQKLLPEEAFYPDIICFHCQQAAEKFLKALWIHHGIMVQKTHDLPLLLNGLAKFEPAIDRAFYDRALTLNGYSVISRYPGKTDDPPPAEVAEAMAAARFFREFALNIVQP